MFCDDAMIFIMSPSWTLTYSPRSTFRWPGATINLVNTNYHHSDWLTSIIPIKYPLYNPIIYEPLTNHCTYYQWFTNQPLIHWLINHYSSTTTKAIRIDLLITIFFLLKMLPLPTKCYKLCALSIKMLHNAINLYKNATQCYKSISYHFYVPNQLIPNQFRTRWMP